MSEPRTGSPVLLRIGEAARLVGVSASTLRVWEREGLIRPRRIRGRTRYYTADQIERLRRIHHLRRVDGLNASGIRRVLSEESPPADPEAPPATHPGARVASERRRRGLSLRDLSQSCDLSVSFLSSFERGQVNASLASLHRIARALDMTAVELYWEEEEGRRRQRLVRPGERKQIRSRNPDLTLELLAKDASSLEPHLVTIPPGGGTGEAYSHPGEEFLYVMSGTIEVILDEVDIYLLGPGDALTFPSETAHRLRNPGSEKAVGLWVNTPPTF